MSWKDGYFDGASSDGVMFTSVTGLALGLAARRGLRIVLDGVFNHVGRSFPAFQAALAGGGSDSR